MSAINVGTLTAVLRADVSKWIPGMKKAGDAADKTNKKVAGLSRALEGMAAMAGAAAVGIGALNWAEQAAQAEQARQVYEAMGGNIEMLRKATQGMISDNDLIKKANMAAELGINAESFAKLAKVAMSSSKVMGLSMTEAFERVILGTAKMEKEILEETGIVFRADAIFQQYAKTHGIAANSIDEATKKQLYINEVINRGQGIISKAGLATSKSADNFARMKTQVSNLGVEVGTRLIPVVSKIAGVIGDLVGWVRGLSEPMKRMITFMAELAIGATLVAGAIGTVVTAAAAIGAVFGVPMAVVIGAAGQLAGALLAVGLVVGLIAAEFETQLNAIGNDTSEVTIDIEGYFKSAFLAVLATGYTLSQGLALVMDTIAYGIVEAAAGIVMIFTVAVDAIASSFQTLGSIVVGVFSKILSTAKSVITAMPGADLLGLDGSLIDKAIGKLEGLGFEAGLDLMLTEQVIAAKKEMQETTFKFSVDETPMELAEQTFSAMGDLMDRSGRGLHALLTAITGDGSDLVKKFKKATDKATVESETKKGTEAFTTTLAKAFGSGGVGGLLGSVVSKGMTGVGGGIATALGIAAPGVGEAIGQGLMTTAGQVGEIISQIIAMTITPLFDQFLAPILSAGEGVAGAAASKGAEAGLAGALVAGLGALGAMLTAVILPILAAFGVLLAPVVFLLGSLAAGIGTLLVIVLAIPAAIGLAIGAIVGFAGFIMHLATQSESYQRFGQALDYASEILVTATEPVFEAFMPLAGVAIMVAEGLAVLISSFVQIEPLMRVIFTAFKTLGIAVLAISGALVALTGGDTNAAASALHALQRATFESAGAMAENAVATNEATEAARSFREEMLNLAPGFNVRLAMSQASAPAERGRYSAATGLPSYGGNPSKGI